MKKVLLSGLFFCSFSLVQAQPWMPRNHQGPVKFSEALANHKLIEDLEESEPGIRNEGEERGEGKEHLFQKWEWYWQQHLDKDGYMVPPSKTLQVWQDYIKEVNKSRTAAKTTAIPSNWIFQGPFSSNGGYSGIGRINVVAFDPIDSNIMYVGSAAGSTWKTTDGGATWRSLYDNLPTLGVADIKINPLNRNTIYVATGDGDAGDAYSSGVIVSHDAGATWSTTGLTWLPTAYNSAKSLLINPLDTNSLILASDAGMFKSYNSGATWTNVDPSGDYKQILYKPNDTNVVYASKYGSFGSSAQIARSINGGTTWTTVTTFTDAQRIALAVSPADPTIVKAIASDNSSGLMGVYGSYNSGATFIPLFVQNPACENEILGYDLGLPTASCGGQGWYDLCIAIDPTDPLKVTVGGINTYYSADGGLSWQIANVWWNGLPGVAVVHADKHYLAYNPLSGTLYETCDGGIYKNYGPVTGGWKDISNGIYITQFYRNAVDNRVSYCLGGAQDNGTKKIDGGVATDLRGGDGMQPLINYADPEFTYYCAYQNGSIDMTSDGGINYHSITDVLNSSGAWITPYCLHPADNTTILLGYKNVFLSIDNGANWAAISPVFNSNYNINFMKVSEANPNYIYTVYTDYTVWRSVINYTTNFGATWDTIPVPFTNFISDIVIDPKNEKRFWVTISGYGGGKVYRYNASPASWTNESSALPDLPANCMVIDSSSGTKYLGTDAAIFYKDTTMTSWALFNTNMPSVHVTDLNINYNTNEIWAATYGRGMWKSIKADRTTPVAINTLTINGTVNIAPNPSNGSFTINSKGIDLKNEAVAVRIITTDGKTVWQENKITDSKGSANINTTLPPGFYICEVTGNNHVMRSKLVVY